MINTTTGRKEVAQPSPSLSPLVTCQINISGLSRHSATALEQYMEEQSIDILAIQEVGLKSNNPNIFKNHITYMNTNHNDCRGVALSIRKSLQPQLTTELNDPNIDIIWATVSDAGKCLLIGSAYCLPGVENTSKLEEILNSIRAAKQYCEKWKYEGMLVYGDYNCRSLYWGDVKRNKRGDILCRFLEKEDLIICSPSDNTFLCTGGGSVIDLLIAHGNIVSKLGIQWIDKTAELFSGAPIRGHLPVLQVISATNNKPVKTTCMDLTAACWEEWGTELEEGIDILGPLNTYTDVKMLWEDILKAISDANKTIPKKTVCQHSKPFWTHTLNTLSLKVREARRAYQIRGTPGNKHNLNEATTHFKEALIKEKNDWIWQKVSTLNTTETNILWKRYKHIFGFVKDNAIGNLKKNGVLHTKDNDKEEVLYNTFFAGEHLESANFDEQHRNTIDKEFNYLSDVNFSTNEDVEHDELNKPISDSEIELSIKDQKTADRCADNDDIYPIMLKMLGPKAIKAMLKLYNLALDIGTWPWIYSKVSY